MADKAMIRIVVCDLDGTILNQDETLPVCAAQITGHLQRHGIRFTVATGRSWELAEPYVSELGISEPCILDNGARIMSHTEEIFSMHLQTEKIEPILSEADKEGLSVVFSFDNRDTVMRPTAWVLEQRARFKRYTLEYVPYMHPGSRHTIHKITLVGSRGNECISRYRSRIEKAMGEKAVLTQYAERELEIVAGGCSKATAIGKLADYHQTDMKNVMIIGDNNNDIEAVQKAGIGVAVGNASQELKIVSDYICKQQYIAGVIEALHRFCDIDLTNSAAKDRCAGNARATYIAGKRT